MLHLMSFENKMILAGIGTFIMIILMTWELKMDAKNKAEKAKNGEKVDLDKF